MLNTKQKGLIAEHRLKAYFLSEGYDILNPEGDYSPFDFVVFKNNDFHKVQSKYISLSDSGTINVTFSEIKNKERLVHKGIQLCEIDIVGIYCPDTDKCYFIYSKDVEESRTCLSLRVTSAKNGQINGVNWADNYDSLDFKEKTLKYCPYCKIYKNTTWRSVRSHTSSCDNNTNKYYIDLVVGPISIEDLQGINSQKDLKNKFPTINGHLTNIKKSFTKKAGIV